MALLRRTHGYARYAISCQYHGGSFLGFSFQGHQNEDTILQDGKTDLRGYRSVESRIRQALDDLFPTKESSSSNDENSLLLNNLPNWENIQVSSRTDRGVHAIKNTFHVDILQQQQQQQDDNNEQSSSMMMISRIHKGLNYHLARQKHSYWQHCDHDHDHDHHEHEQQQEGSRLNNNNRRKRRRRAGNQKKNRGVPQNYNFTGDTYWNRYSANDELRILSVAKAPDYMENLFALKEDTSQPQYVDWNARYSATERTYVYRILCYSNQDSSNFGIPFEWDRSWRIRCNNSGNKFLNTDAMKQAAIYLEGTHDFTSFRAARCQRSSPVVTIKQIQIDSYPYPTMMLLGGALGGTAGKTTKTTTDCFHIIPQLVTIQIVGNSFLYRQVRNMVGCLVDVGLNKLNPIQVQNLLYSKNRKLAPYSMAPPHGLYLVDVKHGNFYF